jgi:hypothetical protein
MSKLIRTNFDRHEQRRDRRYASPAITVTVGGECFAVVDWSLGGFQPVGGPQIAIGQEITGAVTIAGNDQSFEFTAEAVRPNGRGGLGFRFVERSQSLINALDRALIARLMGKRRA